MAYDKCCHITAEINTAHFSVAHNNSRIFVTACAPYTSGDISPDIPPTTDKTTVALLSVAVLGKAILGVQNDEPTDNKITTAILSHGVVGRAILGKE